MMPPFIASAPAKTNIPSKGNFSPYKMTTPPSCHGKNLIPHIGLPFGSWIFGTQGKRDEFSLAFQNILTNLMNLRTTARDMIKLYNGHADKVKNGQIARLVGPALQIDESISRELKKHMQDFLNGGVRVIKDGIQNLTKNLLQTNIGFLFQQQQSFERSVEAMRATDPALADYLLQTRQLWSDRFVEGTRNAMEHKGWQLPDVTYAPENGKIKITEPEVHGQPVTEFVPFMLDRILTFAEEILMHCMQRQLPAEISLAEIPLAQRKKEMPVRFQNTLVGTGAQIWQIAYHTSLFEET